MRTARARAGLPSRQAGGKTVYGQPAPAGQRETVSVAIAAKLLGVSRRAVQYMLEDGRLEGTRIPPRGWWRVRRASLRRLLAFPDGAASALD